MWGLVMGVSDSSRASEVGVDALHNAAVAKAVSDFLVAESPEFLFSFELNLALADGLLLGY